MKLLFVKNLFGDLLLLKKACMLSPLLVFSEAGLTGEILQKSQQKCTNVFSAPCKTLMLFGCLISLEPSYASDFGSFL